MTSCSPSRSVRAGSIEAPATVISDLARQALQARTRGDEVAEGGTFYGFRPFPRRGAAVSNELIDSLRDEED